MSLCRKDIVPMCLQSEGMAFTLKHIEKFDANHKLVGTRGLKLKVGYIVLRCFALQIEITNHKVNKSS